MSSARNLYWLSAAVGALGLAAVLLALAAALSAVSLVPPPVAELVEACRSVLLPDVSVGAILVLALAGLGILVVLLATRSVVRQFAAYRIFRRDVRVLGSVEIAGLPVTLVDDTQRAAEEAAAASGHEPDAVLAESLADEETLLTDRRPSSDPEPFGHPGRPLGRNQPFYLGFVGAIGVFVAWFLMQALVQARAVIVLIVVAMFLAVGLNPTVEWLMRRGMRRPFAVVAVFMLFLVGFSAFSVAVVPPVVQQSQEFIAQAPAFIDDLQQSRRFDRLNENFGVLDNARRYLTSDDLGSRLFGGILGVGKLVLGAVFSTLTVLILTLYFLASLPSIKRQAYLLVPATRRERFALLGDEVLIRIGGYVSGAFIVASIAGASSYVFLTIVAVPYALALSLLVGLLALIPMVGATLGAVIASLIAFAHGGATVGIACLVFYGLYQQVENYYIYPRVMRRAVDVPAAATIMAALVGGALLGVVGALLAIPTAAAVMLIVREVLIPRQNRV